MRVLEVRRLIRNYRKSAVKSAEEDVKVLKGISFKVDKGEFVGIMGKSGCGKTTCGRTLVKLYDATSGTVLFEGKDVSKLKGKELLGFRKDAQIIFQDPYASLDPRMTIGEIITEGMNVHFHMSEKEKEEKVNDLLHKVGLNAEYANRFAHELSGGQRQRVGIARALALEPKFIVCDEPISALDVSIQAQIVNLLIKLQREMGLTYLFISHDLSMVKHISDRVGVMYLGAMVELAGNHALYDHPVHPYTQALISAIPEADPDEEEGKPRVHLEGEVPSPINPPAGCRFKGRCKYAKEICGQEMPELKEVEPNHFVACHMCGKKDW